MVFYLLEEIMAVKQLAISFGIGATIAGGFYKVFSKAETAIESINKKTNQIKKINSI